MSLSSTGYDFVCQRMLTNMAGQKDLFSPAGSVGASASQRSPPETRTPRHAPRASEKLNHVTNTKK